MISHFTDHAANERTFLAWIRTAIAIMALGFLLERFDLLLAFGPGSAGIELTVPLRSRDSMTWIGLILVGCGAGLTVLAAIRFNLNRVAINHPERRDRPLAGLDAALTLVIAVLTAVLAVYLSQSLLA